MRMMVRTRLRGDRGVVGVWLAVTLVVLMGMLALAFDGGLIYVRTRLVQNGNDAAAIGAAVSCAKGEGAAAARTKAGQLAAANSPGATPWSFGASGGLDLPSCNPSGGTVTSYFGGTQTLYISSAIGLTSPATVHRKAKATWGGAGSSANVIPLVLLKNRLSSCNLIPGPGVTMPAVGTQCVFWWDNGALGNASWGFMALDTWGTTSAPSGCSGTGGTSDITAAIWPGLTSPLTLSVPPPTYVCAKNGASVQPVANQIQTALSNGRTEFVMPVSDPALQVNVSGAPYKYAIVGFAHLTPVGLYKKTDSGYSACRNASPPVIPAGGDTANSFCLVTTWQGFSTTGLIPGGGQNFGVAAVSMTG